MKSNCIPSEARPPTKAILFDIDGTLIRAPGAGREALARAAARVFELSLELCREQIRRIDFRGATDAAILARYAELLGHPVMDHPHMIPIYLEELESALAEVEVEALPGVHDILTILAERGDTHCGLLTGNIRAAARMKLHSVGLQHLAEGFGGFGDDGIERQELVEQALLRLAPWGIGSEQTLIIGDTPADVSAARHWGVRAIAVATGWSPLADLQQSAPELLLPNLQDPEPVLGLLDLL